MSFCKFCLILWAFSCQIMYLNAQNCSTGVSNYDLYMPKTFQNNFNLGFYDGWLGYTQQQCFMKCSSDNKYRIPRDDFFSCTGFRWLPSIGHCAIFQLPEESYIDYQPNNTIPERKIYINQNWKQSIHNYKLIVVGDTNHTMITAYAGPGTSFISQEGLRYWWSANLSTSALDFEGATYNFFNRMLVVCGGQQGLAVTPNSSQCWYLNMNVFGSSWLGPLTMKQGRQYPKLVSVQNKVYIVGGFVANSSLDSIELIDFQTQTIKELKDTNGVVVKMADFTNSFCTCAVNWDEKNAFIIIGGYDNIKYSKTAALMDLNLNVVVNLPSMLKSRYRHGCSLLKRNGKDYIVAMGGWSLEVGNTDSTIEFYDLTSRPSTWEMVTGIALPAPSQRIGSVVLRFDNGDCEAWIISSGTEKMHVCSGNYQWRTYTMTKNPLGSKEWVAVDASLF